MRVDPTPSPDARRLARGLTIEPRSLSYPEWIIVSMSNEEPWVCQCRRCCGVAIAADAVQYVWESAFGACAVPVVVGVHAQDDGFVTCGWVYWHDEPEDPFYLAHLHQFIVSCRPGEGTIPTEGDIARWARWATRDQCPTDWLLADRLAFRSVRDCAQALYDRSPMPGGQTISGDWWGPDDREEEGRIAFRERWVETNRRNQAFRGI